MYIGVFLALVVLMGLTILASFWDPAATFHCSHALASAINNIVAMTIAVIKATLVVLFFMHVKFSTRLTKIFAVSGFVWVSLIFLILLDYGTRAWEPVPTWEKFEGSALARQKGMNGEETSVRPR
jgi:cytochrome c oxidase subunit 4